jgi:hypothetical protein
MTTATADEVLPDGVIATLSGVLVRPGVSRNGRYYSAEMCAEAAEAAQARIAAAADPDDPAQPMNIYTHHGGEGDTTRITGRLSKVWVDESNGDVLYDAELADVAWAHDMLNLIDPGGAGQPAFLKGMSLRGFFTGAPGKVRVDGLIADTAEGLDLDGLDFEPNPGVPGAGVRSVSRLTARTPAAAESAPDAAGRIPIYESAPEARVTVTEDATAAPTIPTAPPAVVEEAGPQRFADLGYLGGPAFPLDTAAQARASWHALRESATSDRYTAKQVKRVKERAAKGLKEHGVEVLPNGWLLERAAPTSRALAECFGCLEVIDRGPNTAFTAMIDNGLVTVTVSSWGGIDPHDLTSVARAAMDGAANALDGIDVGDDTAPGGDTVESAPPAALIATESAEPGAPVGEGAAAPDGAQAPTEPSPVAAPAAAIIPTQEGVPDVSEPTTPAEAPAAAAAAPTFTFDQVKELFGSFGAAFAGGQAPAPAAEAAPAPAGTVTEAAPAATPAAPVAEATPVTETADQRDARIAEAAVRAFVQSQQAAGNGPGRKGYVVAEAAGGTVGLADDGLPDKPLHELTDQEWKQVRNSVGAAVAGVTLPA